MKIIYADGRAEVRALVNMQERTGEADDHVREIVREILNNVKVNGDSALKLFGEEYDGAFPDRLEIDKEEMRRAYEAAEPEFIKALENAASNIAAYHENQIEESYDMVHSRDGMELVLGQLIRGLSKVGVYVPGGTAAYPSTVLMNIIPARIAGVEEIIMVTPPLVTMDEAGKRICAANPDILAAAYIAGADRVFLTGGAQAIGALTYGTKTIPKVDKIVGPGNAYVAAAKREVFGRVDIDMIAGPSEILIIADGTANPKFIAADLLSQAEHDPLSASILLTDSAEIAEATFKEVERQTALLGRQHIIEQSIENFGMIVVCRGLPEMIALANEIAPEHLELMIQNPMQQVENIKNAGSVFCGDYSPEPLGDYYSGTNHVLPTSGTARFSSPLGVYSFVKKMSYTMYDENALRAAKDDIVKIAEKEGLTGHANAVRIRFE